VGTGLNLPHYDRQSVDRLWALEPSAAMRALAAPRVASSGLDLQWLTQGAESIPLADDVVDAVVITWTLCTIPDPAAALSEIRRVLRPGGQVHFAEHARAPDPGVQRCQDWLNPAWKRMAGGCHLNRPILELIQDAGMRIEEVDSAYLAGTPRFAGYNIWGVASHGPTTAAHRP